MLTCAALAAALAQAQPPQTLVLKPGEACPTVRIAQVYPKTVTVVADGASIAGLLITGGNLVWRGGTISAPGGPVGAKAAAGYGVNITGGQRVTIEGATVTNAVKGMTVRRGSDDVTVRNVRFTGTLGDGINVTSGRVLVTGCTFDFDKRPDGYHQDAVQWFGEQLTGPIEIRDSLVKGGMQGFGGLGKRPDGVPVKIVNNRIETSVPRAVSVKRESGEVIGNVIGDGDQKWMANIFMGPAIRACGNTAVDFAAARRPAPEWARPCT